MSYLAYVCGVKTVFGCSSQLVRADAVIASDRISKFPSSFVNIYMVLIFCVLFFLYFLKKLFMRIRRCAVTLLLILVK